MIGSGEVDGQPFSVDAVSGPAGENATGSISFDLNIGDMTGDVTCLFATGWQAVVGGPVTGGDAFPPGSGYFFHVDDRAPMPDLVRLELGPIPPGGCTAPFLINPALVTVGDIVVTDAPSPPPFPTSEDQCKKGGWRQFGFKNQGQCVAFVA